MYTIIAVGIGIVVGVLLSTWIDIRNTSAYRKNFNRNLAKIKDTEVN